MLFFVRVQPVRSIFLTSVVENVIKRVCESVHVVFLVTCLLLYCVFYKIMNEL